MGIFLKSKKTEKVKNIRVEGYGGYFFEIEKILKKWKLYEWEDTVVFFCGRYGGVVRGVVRGGGTNFDKSQGFVFDQMSRNMP